MNKIKKSLATLVVAGFVALGFALPAQATEEACVPRDAYSVTTPGTPGVDAVYETVVVSEAGWQRYSLKGSWESDVAPEFPEDNWQPNVAGDPHNVGVAGAYFRSNENSGNVDWFYLEAIAEVTEEVLVSEAIPGTEDVTVDYPAVVCPPDEKEPFPRCEGTVLTSTTSTNLNPNGWEFNEGVEYVDGGLQFSSENDSYVYLTLPEPVTLSEMAEMSFDASPDYGAILFYNDDYTVNVHYEPLYSNPLWTNSPGILPAGGGGQGSSMSGDFEDLLTNPTVTQIAFYVNGGNDVTLHSMTFNCATVTFDLEEVVVPEQPANVPYKNVVESPVDCVTKLVSIQTVTGYFGSTLVNNVWVQDEEPTIESDVTTTRDATVEECPVVIVPPVVIEPPVVVDQPVAKPAAVVIPTTQAKSLAFTGVDSAWAIFYGAVVLGSGLLLTIAAYIRRKVLQQ